MGDPSPFLYLPTLQRLGLALAIGLFVGLEREHRRKEAGLRTFGCGALVGALGGARARPTVLSRQGPGESRSITDASATARDPSCLSGS